MNRIQELSERREKFTKLLRDKTKKGGAISLGELEAIHIPLETARAWLVRFNDGRYKERRIRIVQGVIRVPRGLIIEDIQPARPLDVGRVRHVDGLGARLIANSMVLK